MAVKVLLTKKFFETDINYIKERISEEAEIIIPSSYDEDTLLNDAPEADIFFGPVISKRLCAAASKLKFIQVPWTGVDNLNFDLIKEIGVTVCNSHSNAYAVAEQAIALMMDAAKKISYHDRSMRLGDWNRPKPDKSNTVSPFSKRISNSNVGIIGFGHIGRLIQKYLISFSCKFHVADISVNEYTEDKNTWFYPMPMMDKVLSSSDFVFLCVPLTEQTRDFFDESQFQMMRNDAILINTSRGEIVNEDALYEALSQNIIGGAAMDTWYNNPKSPFDIPVYPSKKYSFERFNNLILSPHRAAMVQGELPHLDDAIANINRTVEGLAPLNIVNIDKKF